MIRAWLIASESGFTPPSVEEFFPPAVLFQDTVFRMTRINLIGVLMTLVVIVFFSLAFRKPQFVPRGIQNAGEVAVNFVKHNIVDEVLGHHGEPYVAYLTAVFYMVLAFNITGFVPGLQIAGTSVIAIPLVLALVSWGVFNVSGIKHQGLGRYLKSNLFPSGVPAPIYILVTPIEGISTFVLRPITLTVRLLANMMSGHLLLVLFFTATSYLLFDASGFLKIFGLAAYAAGFAFTLFEVLVAFLQAYIFALLTAVYLDGAMSSH